MTLIILPDRRGLAIHHQVPIPHRDLTAAPRTAVHQGAVTGVAAVSSTS